LTSTLLTKERAQIDARMAEPGFWNNQAKAKPDIERLKVMPQQDRAARRARQGDGRPRGDARAREGAGRRGVPADASRAAAKLIARPRRFDLEVTFAAGSTTRTPT
jgi:hypothetical protein